MKKFFVLFALVMTAALTISAAYAGLSSPVRLVFASVEPGTAPRTYAEELRKVMQASLPEGSEIEITNGSPGNVGVSIIVDGKEECDLALSNAAPAKWSYEDGIFGYNPTKNVACIAGGIGHDFINIMFTKEFVDRTGVRTIEEVFEKHLPVRIAVKIRGTFGQLSAQKVFEVFGAQFEDIVVWGGRIDEMSPALIKQGIMNGDYDMTIDHIGAGQKMTASLCEEREMVCAQMSDETLAKLVSMGYGYVTVEPGTWRGQTEAIKTAGSQQCVLVQASMDDDVAYTLTKAICENAEELGKNVPAMKHFRPSEAGKAKYTGVPLHPGAARYYTEKGYEIN